MNTLKELQNSVVAPESLLCWTQLNWVSVSRRNNILRKMQIYFDVLNKLKQLLFLFNPNITSDCHHFVLLFSLAEINDWLFSLLFFNSAEISKHISICHNGYDSE